MKKNKLLLFCIILFLFNSCKKDTNSASNSNTIINLNPKISGITSRNEFGELLGETDSTDWRTDDQWSQIEKNLFSNINYNSNCNFPEINVAGYPNTFSNRINLAFFPQDTSIDIEINVVNQRFQKIFSNGYSHQNLLYLNFDSLAPSFSDTIFRVYYRITNNDNCISCGHGDVLRQRQNKIKNDK